MSEREEIVAKIVGASCYFIKSETTIPQIIKKVKELLKRREVNV